MFRRLQYVRACNDAAKGNKMVVIITFILVAYEGVRWWFQFADLPRFGYVLPKLPPFLVACVCLLVVLFLVVEGGYRLQQTSEDEKRQLRKANEIVIKPEDWTRLGKEFEEVYPHVSAFWKDGVWKIEADEPRARQYEVLLEKAGRMFDRNSPDPVSTWLDLVKDKGHFQVEMFNGVQDTKHGGRIPQFPVKSKWVCTELSAACYMPSTTSPDGEP